MRANHSYVVAVLAVRRLGALQNYGVRSRGWSQPSSPTFPKILKASAEFGAAQGDDGVGATSGPVHAGPF